MENCKYCATGHPRDSDLHLVRYAEDEGRPKSDRIIHDIRQDDDSELMKQANKTEALT